MPGREISWLPQEQLDRMQADLIAAGDVTRAVLAEQIIENAAPVAAYRVVDIAANSEDDNTALKAAQYILDRANGKPKTTTNLNLTQDNPVAKILEGVVLERGIPSTPDEYAEHHASGHGHAAHSSPDTYPGAIEATVIDQGPFALPVPDDSTSGSPPEDENP